MTIIQKSSTEIETEHYLSLREARLSTGLGECFGAVEGAECTSKFLAECWSLLHDLGLKHSLHLSKESSKSLPRDVLVTCLKKLYMYTYNIVT